MSVYKVLILLPSVISLLLSDELLTEKLYSCLKLENNDSRLRCYDDLLNQNKKDNENNNSKKSIGKWKEFIDTDPLTDKKIITLTLDANNEIMGNFNFESSRPTLIIRCQNNKTDSYIVWGLYLGVQRQIVTTRIDKERKITRRWAISTDYKATFHPQGYKFAKSLLKHKKLVAKTTPYAAAPVTAIFDITGFENASHNLRKQCKWK